jgi:hypothetical protein
MPAGKNPSAPPASARNRQAAASGASASLRGLRDQPEPLLRGQQADALQNRVRGWQEPRRQTRCGSHQPQDQHKLLS